MNKSYLIIFPPLLLVVGFLGLIGAITLSVVGDYKLYAIIAILPMLLVVSSAQLMWRQAITGRTIKESLTKKTVAWHEIEPNWRKAYKTGFNRQFAWNFWMIVLFFWGFFVIGLPHLLELHKGNFISHIGSYHNIYQKWVDFADFDNQVIILLLVFYGLLFIIAIARIVYVRETRKLLDKNATGESPQIKKWKTSRVFALITLIFLPFLLFWGIIRIWKLIRRRK